MINEAVFCVMEGVATPEAIDTVMKLGMAHPMGPLALADFIGLDVCLAILEVLHRGLGDDKYRACPLLRRMVAAGHLGKKSGRGFYDYGEGRKSKVRPRLTPLTSPELPWTSSHRCTRSGTSRCFSPTILRADTPASSRSTIRRSGPALGGTRFWQYASTDAAIIDALRLARGMTYKSAVAGIDLGGGKSVIIGDNQRVDREALFRAHGRFIETLGGRYITAEDIGTSPADMEYIKLETDHVAGLLGLSGDPSPVTAFGVYVGIKAAAKARWGSDRSQGGRSRCRGAATSPHTSAAICTQRARS